MDGNCILIPPPCANIIKGDFRSNYTQGASIEKYELSDIEKENCIRAAKIVGGSWVGVDFIPAKDNEKDQPFILEVNCTRQYTMFHF